ncbi:Tetraspanin family-domain-containing protein [Mycotypha africana]|uniref:Tetraspanin family-domain-containing protein n=1 Tax=Mycotypha africana TaxID=64632 RepID=UPI0023000068|nr:Tetraspanin family-domain-containing protein [Mycotypha africana]KAI8981975.1 Tetraspanin family-domain-containing protein [Mycotypha africana]
MIHKLFARHSTSPTATTAAGNPAAAYLSQSSSKYSGSFVSLQESSSHRREGTGGPEPATRGTTAAATAAAAAAENNFLDLPSDPNESRRKNTLRKKRSNENDPPADVLTGPVLPWMTSETSRNSPPQQLLFQRSILSTQSSCSSFVEAASLHTVKRQPYPYKNHSESNDEAISTVAAAAYDRESLSVTESINEKRKKYYQTKHPSKRRWTKHKWWLIFINTLLFCYGLAGMLFALLTYFKFYLRADVVVVGQPVILHLILATGVICLFTSLVGYTGIMLNNRCLLSFYSLFLWPCFGLMAAIGYTAYRKNKWNIEGKLSYQWHYTLSSDGRSRIQANLHCCGYKSFTDYHERSNKCFPRTLLPGCRYKYQQLTKEMLTWTYIVAFSMVPVHVLVMISALLCSNHINRTFGKGLPPKLYRLDYQGIVAVAAEEEEQEGFVTSKPRWPSSS